MATLKEIGASLGLSVTTVSRALNGFPEVNAETRSKVQEAARTLGYRPNRVAQRLVTGRSGMVGMIVKIKPDMSADQTFFEMLTGLTAALAAHEYDLVLAVDQDDDPITAYQRLLERDILDGFILNAPTPDDPRVRFLTERNIPFVLHGQDRPDPAYPNFGIDNAEVTQRAVTLLAHLKHRRIALLNGELRHAYAVDRITGFEAAVQAHGLGPVIQQSGITFESDAYTHALDMLAQEDAPTAFVCASTVIAAGVMAAVRDRGLRIPQDVSVIAHDDALPLTRAISFDPALTVTRAPLRDACVPLARLLMEHLKGTPARELQQRQPIELIVRQSTGPAPKEA